MYVSGTTYMNLMLKVVLFSHKVQIECETLKKIVLYKANTDHATIFSCISSF